VLGARGRESVRHVGVIDTMETLCQRFIWR
jgi:hypothetical protein